MSIEVRYLQEQQSRHINRQSKKIMDLEQKLAEAEKKLEIAVKALKESSSALNSIKSYLTNRVYTLDEDEYAQIYYARDLTDCALKEITNVRENGKRMTGEPDKELPTDYRPNGNW